MGAYLLRRLLGLIPVLLIISVVTFLTTALVRGGAQLVASADSLLGDAGAPISADQLAAIARTIQSGLLELGRLTEAEAS